MTFPSKPHKQNVYLPPRLDGIDIARGVAIMLMILSHTIKGLLHWTAMPPFAISPIHTITKFSSSLFILVFGISVGLFYLPKVDSKGWGKRRARLVFRAIEIMFWYKMLTLVQMFQTYDVRIIADTLIFKRFPDFTEILGFYSFLILILAFLLPLWARVPMLAKLVIIPVIYWMGLWMNANFDFWGVWQVKAILVEHKGTFCFGLFQRGALALFGVLIGEFIYKGEFYKRVKISAVASLVIGVGLLVCFFVVYKNDVSKVMISIAKNYGKHPPMFHFMLWSLGGSFLLLGLTLPLRSDLGGLLRPFAIIGRESLFVFNYHIVFIFVVLRFILDLRRNTTYPVAFAWFVTVFALGVGLAAANSWRKRLHK
jgi:uncharacterized membrane protein